ncbi:O-acetylhomoserine aminocarboxypropyltransferase/cysteine synthase [Kocuria sp. JC486]|uniref:O-acetylhomoserine aminocarboxypropyltransferase/cysteine synthase family protein n=1 Tax=Kocuria sp. JC486 TaxID=1970736 RepID=UPI001423D841|nr:aminotransferase class I/II-fold pyridoxal phosphate-dependent enzyme [Kocuria sp. JC486]NHU86353.1 O-acetylhomoserine aminocarboxypropyltransferase/cysteine synthase [Kocuria sp. JC486]
MTLSPSATINGSSSLATRQIHAGRGGSADSPTQATLPVPIYQSSAFEFPDHASAAAMFAQTQPGFTYSRTGNPTVAVLEARSADLEGGIAGLALGSGQSAVAAALLALVSTGPGKHLVVSEKIYGGTVDLLGDTLADLGVTVTYVDPTDASQWAAAVTDQTRGFFLESIGNPLSTLADLDAIAEVAHEAGVPVVVDNTLATPVLYRPIEHGADIVVHSATKYFGGHGTALAGVIVDAGRFDWEARPERWPQFTSPRERWGHQSLVDKCRGGSAFLHLCRAKFVHDLGLTLSPFNASQIIQGMETLDLRVRRHSDSAARIARFLDGHPAVRRVHHPVVESSVDHRIAERDYPSGTGAVFAFELNCGPERVPEFVDSLRLFKLVANIGDVRSLVAHPAAMTHCRLTEEQRLAGGITWETLRLSIGLEAVEDLIADLQSSLDELQRTSPASARTSDVESAQEARA